MNPTAFLQRTVSCVCLLPECKALANRMPLLLLLAASLVVSGCGGAPSPSGANVVSPVVSAATSVNQFQPNVKWGGRTVAIDVNPSNAAVAIAASESGGLFSTADSGATWSHIDTLQPFRMSDVKFAHSNPQIVIASALADGRTTNAGGIVRSVDGGATWQKPATSNPPCSSHANTFGITFGLEANDVFVGTDCGVAVSHDLGATWTHVALSRTLSISATGGGIVDTCSADGHHRSTDNGGTFGAADPIGPAGSVQTCSGGAVHGIVTSPFDPNVLFAVNPGPVTPAPNTCNATNPVRFQLLSESDDGGVTWIQIGQACSSRPPWVALNRSTDGIPGHLDLYFSGGLDTRRETCTRFSGPGLRCGTLPSSPNVTSDHADHNGLAFMTSSTSNCAQYLVSDGGVHKTTDCGASWTITGAGNGGYNALQLYEIDGQVHPDHTDVYMGTQDNDVWASGDDGTTWATEICCEGFFFQVSHSSASDAGQNVTGVTCFGCSNFLTSAHFSGFGAWPNPSGTVMGNPFLVGPSEYVQFNQPSPPSNSLNLTTDTGGSWAAATTVAQSLSGRPYISGPAANPTIYQAITKPGGLVGLLKITGVGTGTVTVSNADTGLNSIGTYCMGAGTFVCPTVFGVDPNNPLHLIAADVGSNEMKFSTDGGASWTVDSALTTLVTGNGQFLFSVPNVGVQAHAIFFDPTNSNRILVGTEANGVIASLDGGLTWGSMFQSNQVPAITSFFFDEVQNNVLVSSYGRGLWKLAFVSHATALAYTGDTTADFHDPATLTAVLTDTSITPAAPVPGVPVTFTLGAQSCSAPTNINGQASCIMTLNQVPGSYTVTASFAGNGLFLASSNSAAFTITREETTLTYTGDTLIANGGTAHLSGVLLEDGSVPIAGRTVKFTLGTVTPQDCSATTDATGTAQCTITPVVQPIGSGTVAANFAGDPFYLPSSATAQTLLFAFPDHGSFVVGNLSDTGSVTFWDAQWWKLNSLSGGAAPASFKGFANTLSSTPPICAGSWSTAPGNSSSPPASVPSFMAVIASSAIAQTGSDIAGDIPEIVIVQTAPGYAPNPGHSGTGTVVAVLCKVTGTGKPANALEKVSTATHTKTAPGLQTVVPKFPVQKGTVAASAATSTPTAVAAPAPYLQLIGTVAISGQATAFTGETVTAHGSGFCGTAICSPVMLTIGDHIVAKGVQVDAAGRFTATFTVDEIPSRYTVTASQNAADGSVLTDSAPLVVAITDAPPASVVK